MIGELVMKKYYFLTLLLLTLMISTNANALGELNCSNADGSVKRVEKEIWGANPVTWTAGGIEWSRSQFSEEFDSASKKILSTKETKNKEVVEESEEIYAVKVKLTTSDLSFKPDPKEVIHNEWVICRNWENIAKD